MKWIFQDEGTPWRSNEDRREPAAGPLPQQVKLQRTAAIKEHDGWRARVRLITLAEMLDVVEQQGRPEQLLQTLGVPAYSIRSPIFTPRMERWEPVTADDVVLARCHTAFRSRSRCPDRTS